VLLNRQNTHRAVLWRSDRFGQTSASCERGGVWISSHLSSDRVPFTARFAQSSSVFVSRTRARIAPSCANSVQATSKDPSSERSGELWVSRRVGQPRARRAGDSSSRVFLSYAVAAIGLHTLNSIGYETETFVSDWDHKCASDVGA